MVVIGCLLAYAWEKSSVSMLDPDHKSSQGLKVLQYLRWCTGGVWRHLQILVITLVSSVLVFGFKLSWKLDQPPVRSCITKCWMLSGEVMCVSSSMRLWHTVLQFFFALWNFLFLPRNVIATLPRPSKNISSFDTGTHPPVILEISRWSLHDYCLI